MKSVLEDVKVRSDAAQKKFEELRKNRLWRLKSVLKIDSLLMNTNKPTLIVVAGPNGSGKTSVTTQILKHEWIEGCVYINSDTIAMENLKKSIAK
jgi:ABC-type Mn2+/Zn2+ transport system ATPase subunit